MASSGGLVTPLKSKLAVEAVERHHWSAYMDTPDHGCGPAQATVGQRGPCGVQPRSRRPPRSCGPRTALRAAHWSNTRVAVTGRCAPGRSASWDAPKSPDLFCSVLFASAEALRCFHPRIVAHSSSGNLDLLRRPRSCSPLVWAPVRPGRPRLPSEIRCEPLPGSLDGARPAGPLPGVCSE